MFKWSHPYWLLDRKHICLLPCNNYCSDNSTKFTFGDPA